MYEVEVKIKFRAGHRLLPPYNGACNNPHGEGYTSILVFQTDGLDKNGMVVDFGYIKKSVKEWVDAYLDHSYIYKEGDEVGEYLKSKGFRVYKMKTNPTAENIAELLFSVVEKFNKNIYKVGVVESFNDSVAWYCPEENNY